MKSTLSIITIAYNNLHELIRTCQSVDEQTLLPEEHLIIDGSVNEEIRDWLARQPQPGYRRWVHERDNGISDAFNKGLKKAAGLITHLLNSGDCYFGKKVTERVMAHFEDDPALMWTHAKYVQHRGDVDVISGAPFEKDKLWKGMRTVAHPTMFIKKELYQKWGYYHFEYKIAMDYDLLIRIRNEKFYFIPEPLIYFAPGGASDLQFKKGLAEVKKIHQSYLGKDVRMILWQIRQKLLHGMMRSRIGKKMFVWKNKRKVVSRQE